MNSEVNAIKVGVVLLNWNGGEFTIPCIRSLLKGEVVPWKILIYDNGSTDGSPQQIQQLFPYIDQIRNAKNIGFTDGNNEGMLYLLKVGAEAIWILNNDTLVDASCLRIMLDTLEQEESIDVITGKIHFEEPSGYIWYAGAICDHQRMIYRHKGLREKDLGQYDVPGDVDFVSGCCMLIRRRALEQIGLLNHQYVAYFEDAEWCLRARRARLRLYYEPKALLSHRQHASALNNSSNCKLNKASPLMEFYNTRNYLFIVRAHSRSASQRIKNAARHVTERLYRATGLLALGRWRSTIAIIRGLWHGLWDPIRSQTS
jgi:GT2 family glycosyltransferase